MSLYANALAAAADTQDIQAGGTGFLGDLGNALTAGAAGAVVSGLGSIYNTAAAGINAIGGSVEEIDTYKKLSEVDTNWASYYKEHENAIDVVGFIGTSLIPGTIAVKGLNAVRAGSAGNALGRSLNFARTKQAEALDAAIVELAAEGGTAFTRINKSKMAAMGWAFADQTLTAAAFETGVALTMKQSPLLADDSWWDIGKTALLGATFGGVIGGGIDSVILNRGFKDAVKKIDGRQRTYDYQQVLEKFNLSGGDKAYGVMDSVLRLPDSVLEADKIMELSFRIAEGQVKRNIDLTQILTGSLKSAEKTAMLDFEKSLRAIGQADDEAAAGLARLIGKEYLDLKGSGASTSVIRERLGDRLHELVSVRPATDTPTVPSTDLWYFNKALGEKELANIKTVDDWKNAFTKDTPFEANAYKNPYQFIGSIEDQKMVFADAARIGKEGDNGYPNLTAAWKDGKHVAFNTDGTVRVNDSSRYWKRIDDPVYNSSRYLNTKTGAITEDAVLTAADRIPQGKRLSEKGAITSDAVYLPIKVGNTYSNKVIRMGAFNAAGDVEYFTARHAWAAKLKDIQLPKEIDVNDFSLMDRLRTVADAGVLETISLRSGDDILGTAADLSLPAAIKSAKLSAAQDAFQAAYEKGVTLDVRELAYRLNTDATWLENAVASRFRDSLSGEVLMDGRTITNLDGLSRNLDDYLTRETVIAEYARPQQFKELTSITPEMSWRDKRLAILDQVAMTGGQFVTGELAWQYRVTAAIAANKNAAGAALGSERMNQLLDLAQDAAKLADSTGVGANFLSSANANYGDLLKLWSQDTGKKVHLWINEDVAAVVDSFSTVATRLRADPKAGAELGIVTNMLRSSDDKYIWNPENPKQLILRDLKGLTGEKLAAATETAKAAGKRLSIDIESDVTAEFFKIHTNVNAGRVGKRSVLTNARGLTSNIDGDTVYAPPIDTTYFKHFAFVRPIDGKAFGTSEVSMVFGRDAAELNKRIAAVDKNMFNVTTKGQTEEYLKAKNLYDFDLTINEPRINSELRRSGALSNFFPEIRSENMIEDYLRWHQNQTARLVRDAVETNYGQQVAELRKLGESYVEVASSKFAGTLRASKSEVINPYDDYVKTALDVSKRSEYTFFHQANEFVDALGTRAYQALQSVFGDAKKGIVTWEEANRIAERHGIKGMYSGEADFFTANVPRDRNLVKEYVSKANMLLANFVLRFDFANSLLNVISTPMMLGTELASIKSLAKNDPAVIGKLAELTAVKVPGENLAVPSNSRLVFNAVKNFWGTEKQQLIARYTENGDIKTVLSQYHSMMDDMAMRADFKLFKEGTDRAFEKAATLTGNNWAEQFTRFVSADVMRQLSDPLVEGGKLSLKEQNAYISTFVNRVQGNYISSQRPIVFQGVLGSAIGLFQTYSFNMLQQLFRHVENRDKRAIATLFGMQAGLFGLNGTPMFEAVNTHIIGNAAINDGHYDAYSLAPAILGKDVGDWLMYGTASAMPGFGDKWPSLYTRGDINPRHVSILPLNPMDIPAIDASVRVAKNLADVGSKLINGADIGTTLLQGLEHNGVNRPLAGFAQVASRQSTTSKGGLIAASSDFSLIATAARIAGSRPMDESIALNAMYRNKAYQAADSDRMQFLGERVKSYLYKNQFPPDDVMDGFMKDYAAAGGRVENFNRAMQTWSKDANISTVEKMRAKLGSSYGQRLNEIMGGVPLEDSRSQSGGSEQLLPE
jgi:hypothetical protein